MHGTLLRFILPDLQIKESLEALTGVGEVTVTYGSAPLSHDLLGNFCPGRTYSVVFETTPGDLSMISVDQEFLTGDGASAAVEEVSQWSHLTL